jgi:ornithine carbamoyltransferase
MALLQTNNRWTLVTANPEIMKAKEGKVKISSEVLSQEINGETVLMDLASEQYFGLDAVGTRVWQLLKEGRSRQQLAMLLLDEFAVEQEQLEADITVFLEKLSAAGLITMEAEEDFS